MNKLNISLIMLSFFFCTALIAQPPKINRGLFLTITDSKSENPKTERFWFRDSVIIFEQKAYFSASSNDTTILNDQFEVYKYTYFDLRTLRCQDYFGFSDTVTVANNYIVKPYWYPGSEFITKAEPSIINDNMKPIEDTVINNERHMRTRYRDSIAMFKSQFEQTRYYLCDKPIWIIRKPDERYPGCMLVRLEIQDILRPIPVLFIIESMIERTSLTKEEENIFAAWGKNARVTKIPVSKIEDLRKNEIIIPLKYKDHPFYHEMIKARGEKLSN